MLEDIEDSKATESLRIWGLSGAGFVIRYKDDIIYVDPWLVPPDPKRTTHRAYAIPFSPETVTNAAAVISTHEHEDHCNVSTVSGLLSNSRALFFGPTSAVEKVLNGGVPKSRVVTLSAGSVIALSSTLRIRAFEASDPYEPHATMIMIETDRGNVLHSGDTWYFPGFARVGDKFAVNVALLNFGKQIPTPEKPYYMNAEKVALAARDLHAKIVVPMHWNLWQETKEDPHPIESILKLQSPQSEFRIVEGGELLEV